MYCPNCGCQNENNAKFCMQCGTNFSEKNESTPQKKNNKGNGKKILSGCGVSLLIFLIVFMGIIIISAISSDDTSADTTNSTTEKIIESTTEDSIIYVTVDEMIKDFKANEVAAEKKYKDQLVAVKGTIYSINVDMFGATCIMLDGHNGIQVVQCYMKDSEENKVAELNVGDKITLIGEYSSYSYHVLMQWCEIDG